MPPPLFKKKANKMKKGIQAVVLMGGLASLVGVNNFFSFLPISNEWKRKFRVERPLINLNPSLPTRRAQSMSVLPARITSSIIEENDHDDFADFEAQASQFEAHRAGLILQMEQSASSASLPNTIASSSTNSSSKQGRYSDLNGGNSRENSRYPGLASHAPKNLPTQMFNRTQPHHPQRARRIQSAPSVALSHLSPNLLDDLDAWETDDFTLSEWVVPEVREKAIRQQERPEVEDWNEDFEVEDGDEGLEVPNYMQSIQTKFKHDMLHMRQFALHIQDLKAIQRNAAELEQSLLAHYEDDIEMMRIDVEEVFCQVKLLIQLADYQEEKDCAPLTKQDLDKLNMMISDSLRGQSSSNLDFGDEMMTRLLESIPSLKRELVTYVGQLRGLLSI